MATPSSPTEILQQYMGAVITADWINNGMTLTYTWPNGHATNSPPKIDNMAW